MKYTKYLKGFKINKNYCNFFFYESMNSNVLVEVERKIKDALGYVKDNFLCENKFVGSKIANH